MYITGARESSLCPTATRPLLLESAFPFPSVSAARDRSSLSGTGGPRGLSSGRTRQFRDGTRDPRAATRRFRVDDEYFFLLPPPPSLPSFLRRGSFYFLRFSVRGEGRVIGLRFVSDTLRDGIIRSSIYVYIFFNRLGGRSNIHLLIRTCKVYCYIYTYGFVGSDYEYYEVRFFDFFP